MNSLINELRAEEMEIEDLHIESETNWSPMLEQQFYARLDRRRTVREEIESMEIAQASRESQNERPVCNMKSRTVRGCMLIHIPCVNGPTSTIRVTFPDGRSIERDTTYPDRMWLRLTQILKTSDSIDEVIDVLC